MISSSRGSTECRVRAIIPSKQARLLWANQEPEPVKQNMSGKVRTRKCPKIELRSRVFVQQTNEYQTRHVYWGQREMLRNGLSDKKASQTRRKAKSHKVTEMAENHGHNSKANVTMIRA